MQRLTHLTDLEKADRDRHREDEQRRDQDPEIVRRMNHVISLAAS
jgi:hypothetical protein